MKPITFACEGTFRLAPEDIARQILDLTKWPDFHGYGPLPGIKVAEFEVQTPGIVGTRIRVTDTDGSSHIEEIVEWEPDRRLRLLMHEFSAPLRSLTFFNNVITAGPQKGQTDKASTSYIYRVTGDMFVEVNPAPSLKDIGPQTGGPSSVPFPFSP